MRPVFATFTGVDDHTDITRLLSLSDQYDCEFGVLFSKARQGQGRYPSIDFVNRFLDKVEAHGSPVKLAAHVCGSYARSIMDSDFAAVDELDLKRFSRIQVNHTQPNLQVLESFAQHTNRTVIAQWRDSSAFVLHSSLVQFLYDPSGGRGDASDEWPSNSNGEQLVGYSGGISPENVMEIIHQARSIYYWIDMETGVRTDDIFDLDKVEDVLTQLYQKEAA